jgi:hypothetical protein
MRFNWKGNCNAIWNWWSLWDQLKVLQTGIVPPLVLGHLYLHPIYEWYNSNHLVYFGLMQSWVHKWDGQHWEWMVPCISGELTRIEWKNIWWLGTQLGIKTSLIDEFIIIILEINLFGSIKIREIDLWEHHLGTILNWLEQLLVVVGSFWKIVKVENGFILIF